jgi:AraC family transcriptional regulator
MTVGKTILLKPVSTSSRDDLFHQMMPASYFRLNAERLEAEFNSYDFGWPGLDVCRAVIPAMESERVGDSSHFLVATLDGSTGHFRKSGRRELHFHRQPEDLLLGAGVPGEHWISRSSHETWSMQVVIPPELLRAAWAADTDRPVERLELRTRLHFRDPRLLWIARAMVDEAAQGCPTGETYRQTMAMVLARYLVACYSNVRLEPRRERLTPSKLKAVLDAIEAGLESPLRLDDLAQLAGVSVFHFARAFKASTGLAPHQHVLRRRVERAHDLILHARGLPLSEIAAQCGFSDQSHMGLALRRLFGVSPMSLRGR